MMQEERCTSINRDFNTLAPKWPRTRAMRKLWHMQPRGVVSSGMNRASGLPPRVTLHWVTALPVLLFQGPQARETTGVPSVQRLHPTRSAPCVLEILTREQVPRRSTRPGPGPAHTHLPQVANDGGVGPGVLRVQAHLPVLENDEGEGLVKPPTGRESTSL